MISRGQGVTEFRNWHIADVQLALTNVCFGGKNGHDVDAGLLGLAGLSLRFEHP